MRRRIPQRILKDDPIEHLIDRQLGSLWRASIYRLVKAKSGKTRLENSSVRNTIEDQFIEAIDKKYHGRERRKDQVISLLEKGYSQEDIAVELDMSVSSVGRCVRDIKEGIHERSNG